MLIPSTIILGKASLFLSAQRKLIVWRTAWKENNMISWQNQSPLLSTYVDKNDFLKFFSLLFPRGMLFISVFLQAGACPDFCNRICIVLSLFQVLLNFRGFPGPHVPDTSRFPFPRELCPCSYQEEQEAQVQLHSVFVWQLLAPCWAAQRHLPVLLWIKAQSSLFHHQKTLKRKTCKLGRNGSDVTLFQ